MNKKGLSGEELEELFPGLFGPFENPDDINKYWHQVTEKELEEYIEQAKKDSEDSDNSKEDKEIDKQDLKRWNEELDNLRIFVDDHTRCVERYKFDKKILQQIQDDWYEYNTSLWTGYNRIQQMKLDSSLTKGEGLKQIQSESRAEKIKREEIEKRIKDLLLK